VGNRSKRREEYKNISLARKPETKEIHPNGPGEISGRGSQQRSRV